MNNASGLAAQQFAHLSGRQALYRRVAGGWPPGVQDAAQLRELQALMVADLAHATSFVAANPSRADGKLLLADLLRMAHNLDVPDTARRADELLGELLAADPRHGEAAMCRGSLYVTLSPELAPRAEADFRLALSLQPAAPDPLIHQGLGLACLHQGRRVEALEHLRRYLDAVPQDARIAQLVARMAADEQPRTVRVAPPSPRPAEPPAAKARDAGVAQHVAPMAADEQPCTVRVAPPSPPSDEQAPAAKKPRWKFW